MLNDAYMGKGKSAPLSAPATGGAFGPELGFGYVMGAFHEEPVIVIKADIGNRSLGWDILPPGTESWEHEGKHYPGYGMRLDANGKPVKAKEGQWYAGKQYDEYTEAIRKVLDNFDEQYPEYADQGFEVAGFVWWQGHKDGPNPGHNAYYERNLVNLIKSWRKEFNAPEAKWAIATVGFHGEDMQEHYVKIAEAQMAVADPERHPELAGTVKTIDTRPFWRPAAVSPKNQYYHYHHNGETYMLTGDALGRAMVELYGGKVEYPCPEMGDSISYVPDYERASGEQMQAMQDAMRPIVLDKLVPAYVAEAPGTPAYRRGGLPIENIVGAKMPEKPSANLSSQYDRLLNLYEIAGIDDYAWKACSPPEMQLARWHYLSFDPPEKKTDPKGDRYREVTLPKGSENWLAADFNPSRAGWKTGQAPFGQKDGEQVALRPGCQVSYCGCHITPNTLWEKEVLLLRQNFKFPHFEKDKRYRLIVGGAGHTWSGEGFALYLDGEKVSELTGGGYKNGGYARGVYLFGDLAEKVSGQELTVAVKAFLRRNHHRNRPAPPSGHLSIWLESAKLPAVLDSIPLEEE
jgi:alpha-galactosidase